MVRKGLPTDSAFLALEMVESMEHVEIAVDHLAARIESKRFFANDAERALWMGRIQTTLSERPINWLFTYPAYPTGGVSE